MRLIQHNKLVRDEIAGAIETENRTAKVSRVSGMVFRKALESKLLEELEEWQADHELEELADLYEVIRAMAAQAGYSFDEVKRIAQAKRKERGSFSDGVWLEYVMESSDLEADKETIVAGLRAYNKSKIGEKSFPTLLIELDDGNGQRIGAISGQISWDYFEVRGFYVEPEYRSKGYGRALVEAAAFEARERFGTPQVEFVTSFPDLQDFLAHMGCVRQAELSDMPKGFDNAFLYFDPSKVERPAIAYRVEEDAESETAEWLQKKNQEALNAHQIDGSKVEKSFLAVDRDLNPLGGVYGYISRDWLYVSLLWVDEAARGRGIGNLVMEAIETWASEQGIQNAYVGTAQFQARPFYEKRGYRVINTCVDQPIGYECYTLIKEI